MDYRRKLKSPHRLTPLDHVRELYEGAGYYLRCKRDLRPATAQPVADFPCVSAFDRRLRRRAALWAWYSRRSRR